MALTCGKRSGRYFGCSLVVILVMLVGCSEDKPSVSLLSLKGKIEKIDRTSDRTGTITVQYFNEKQSKEVLGSAIVTADTEIMINGALAKLSDLREGDRVRGKVRVEKKGGLNTQTVLQMRVDRAQATPTEDG